MDKQRERRAVEDLQRLYADFPPGAVEEYEVPDFIVRAESSCVGIEVTEYFRPERPMGTHPKEQESLQHHITARSTEICLGRRERPFLGVVSFAHGIRITKRDIDLVATAIADACAQAGAGIVHNDGQLPSCIDDITVYPLGPKHAATITSIGTTWAPPVDEDELARIIAAKESKLLEYRKACETVWLLIVIDGFQLSSMTETPAKVAPIASSFDRVLVLHDRHTVTVLAD